MVAACAAFSGLAEEYLVGSLNWNAELGFSIGSDRLSRGKKSILVLLDVEVQLVQKLGNGCVIYVS
jgi:hypothetical protein